MANLNEWLSLDLSLEGELIKERGKRAIARADDLEALRDLASALFENWILNKHLLDQHIKKVCDLENEVAKFKPHHHPQN